MLIVGQAVYVWRQRVYRKFLYLSLNFSVKLILILKINYIRKEKDTLCQWKAPMLQPLIPPWLLATTDLLSLYIDFASYGNFVYRYFK